MNHVSVRLRYWQVVSVRVADYSHRLMQEVLASYLCKRHWLVVSVRDSLVASCLCKGYWLVSDPVRGSRYLSVTCKK